MGGGDEKKPGACGCGGGAGAAATEPDEKAAPCGHEGGAEQRAVIDPTTGQLVVPHKGDAAAASTEDAVTDQPKGSVKPAAATAQQLAVPGAGVMAPFPKDRASHAVATVGESGQPQAGCEHGAE